jgi:hypothetical protein
MMQVVLRQGRGLGGVATRCRGMARVAHFGKPAAAASVQRCLPAATLHIDLTSIRHLSGSNNGGSHDAEGKGDGDILSKLVDESEFNTDAVKGGVHKEVPAPAQEVSAGLISTDTPSSPRPHRCNLITLTLTHPRTHTLSRTQSHARSQATLGQHSLTCTHSLAFSHPFVIPRSFPHTPQAQEKTLSSNQRPESCWTL